MVLTYSSFYCWLYEWKTFGFFCGKFFKQSPLVLVTQKDIYTPADLKNKKRLWDF